MKLEDKETGTYAQDNPYTMEALAESLKQVNAYLGNDKKYPDIKTPVKIGPITIVDNLLSNKYLCLVDADVFEKHVNMNKANDELPPLTMFNGYEVIYYRTIAKYGISIPKQELNRFIAENNIDVETIEHQPKEITLPQETFMFPSWGYGLDRAYGNSYTKLTIIRT